MKNIELISRTEEQRSGLIDRIAKLDFIEVKNILSQLDSFETIMDTCETREELNACLLCNIESDNIDEIEILICESGK